MKIEAQAKKSRKKVFSSQKTYTEKAKQFNIKSSFSHLATSNAKELKPLHLIKDIK